MLKKIIYFAIFIIATLDVAYAETVTLKSNTIVVVKSTEEVSTKKYKPGQDVIFSAGASFTIIMIVIED